MTGRRVLHLINGEYFGGSARVLLNYLTSPNRTSDVVVGVLFEGELARRCRAAGIPLEVVPMRSRLDLRAVAHVRRMVAQHEVELIHTHQVRNTLLGRLAGTIDRKAIVTHIHSPAFRESTSRMRNWVTGGIDRALARATRRFITVSESLARDLTRQGLPGRRIRVVPNGIVIEAPPPADLASDVRSEFGVPAGRAVIGMVANFRPRKGTEDLMDAVSLIFRTGRDLHLLLVGEAFREPGRDYRSELVRRAGELGILDRFTLTGYRADVGRLMAGMDVFVLPSRFGEGLPMVLLEAMAAQRPVIATPVEGIPEVLVSGQNGVLVPIKSPMELAERIVELLDSARKRSELGIAARNTVVHSYSRERMTAGIEAVYQELWTGHR